jgi:hypothetical protein
MNRASTFFAVGLLLAASVSAHLHQETPAPAASLDIYNGCPMEGVAQSAGVRALNRLKNRYTAPTSDQINPAVTLAAIVAPGNDIGRWKVKFGADITGYVADVKPGGVETVNCHAKDWAYRDTHIELVLDPMASTATKRVIVEVTPRWRDIMSGNSVDWSTQALRDKFLGRWVKVTGWMLFDVEHGSEAENTAPGRPRNWRATAWEVHPVTAIEVVQRPR